MRMSLTGTGTWPLNLRVSTTQLAKRVSEVFWNNGTQRTHLDCPACGEASDARYLGTADTDKHAGHVVGWECVNCGAELQEHVHPRGDSFDLREVQPEGDQDG